MKPNHKYGKLEAGNFNPISGDEAKEMMESLRESSIEQLRESFWTTVVITALKCGRSCATSIEYADDFLKAYDERRVTAEKPKFGK